MNYPINANNIINWLQLLLAIDCIDGIMVGRTLYTASTNGSLEIWANSCLYCP